jgi:hypothetical protein
MVWLWRRRRRGSFSRESPRRGAGVTVERREALGIAVGMDAPPAEDDRVRSLRRRVSAGGTLSEEEQAFLRSEGVGADPDDDPLAAERGGKLGRGFWDEDRGRDLG